MRPRDIEPRHIAAAMGLSLGKAWELAKHFECCYKPERKQRVGRKTRVIDPLYRVPKRWLRRLHRWIQEQGLFHPRAHGGVRRRSCFTSATVHAGARCIWTRDASDCYPSVTPDAFIRELWCLGFRYDTAKLLTLLCTVRGRLPQGSPISCDALNLFFWRLDQSVASAAGSGGLRYSRVADDFVLSGKAGGAGEAIASRIENELGNRGIRVNEKKKANGGFQSSSEDRRVHGISVSKRRGTAINREQAAQARKLADSYLAASKSVSCETIQALGQKRLSLAGWMYYCRQADFSPAKEIRQKLEAGDRRVLRKLRSLGITVNKNKWWLMSAKANEPRRLATLWKRRSDRSRREAEFSSENGVTAVLTER